MPENFISRWFHKKSNQEKSRSQPETVLPAEAPQPVIVPAIPEDPFRAEAAQMAREVLAELESKEGKRCFVLIVDDDPRNEKIPELKNALNKLASEAGVNYVIRNTATGAKGIRVYEEFAKLASGEQTVIFMDGDLRPELGGNVTRDLFIIAGEHNLKLPMIVADSGDEFANQAIQKACPQGSYLGSFVNIQDRMGSLATLDSRL